MVTPFFIFPNPKIRLKVKQRRNIMHVNLNGFGGKRIAKGGLC